MGARVAASAEFTLKASHGYRVTFSGNGPGGGATLYGKPRAPAEKGAVAVEVQGPAAPHSVSYYSAAGRFHPSGFSGRLGKFGRVAVRFHRQHAHLRRVPGCKGKLLHERGVFKGTIRFRGERGYTEIAESKARGYVDRPNRVRCHFGGGGGDRSHRTELEAGAQRPCCVEFDVEADDHGRRRVFFALDDATTGRVEIFRTAFALAGPDSFTFAPDLTSAHVEPGGPFAGSADFAAPNLWTGDLSVSFPGAPNVPLAGDGFKAKLKRF